VSDCTYECIRLGSDHPDCPAHGVTATLRDEVARLTAERDEARADAIAAAGELLIPIPPPGTDLARTLSANILLRRERDEAHSALTRSEEARREAERRAERWWEVLCETVTELGQIAPEAAAYAAGWAKTIRNERDAAEAKAEALREALHAERWLAAWRREMAILNSAVTTRAQARRQRGWWHKANQRSSRAAKREAAARRALLPSDAPGDAGEGAAP
jgi:hypothetical protein